MVVMISANLPDHLIIGYDARAGSRNIATLKSAPLYWLVNECIYYTTEVDFFEEDRRASRSKIQFKDIRTALRFRLRWG